ncbi:MAG: diaminopimelate decarboxylase [Rikenellaceae bacterium]|jgi:diaminopimelate decarboxylase|nr:diaminopimelate decarboxylase [Rikenellaceae bacterium]
MIGSARYTERLGQIPTPFYFYDMELLRATLDAVSTEAGRYGYKVHYALKANFNERIVTEMKRYGLGADCVSGGEVRRAIDCGIPASDVVFAGVAKTDQEIILGLDEGIFSFNCESREELEVINALAAQRGKIADIALRINPDVDAMTHQHITTGKADSKFGISYQEIDQVIARLGELKNLNIVGIHFHIGSQITHMEPFEALCERANALQDWFEGQGINLRHINVGGGLGIDYIDPSANPIPDFATYFAVFHNRLKVRPGQTVHFELGRSLVGQCGELLTRVLYNKVTSTGLRIALVDAGFPDLIRPALYGASHRIENLTSATEQRKSYMVAGPICESSDIFARGLELPETRRGDLLRLMSAGAYGRAMASNYNLRPFPAEIFSDEL